MESQLCFFLVITILTILSIEVDVSWGSFRCDFIWLGGGLIVLLVKATGNWINNLTSTSHLPALKVIIGEIGIFEDL